MTSQDILYSKGENDECYTPDYAVKPILKYLPKDKIIWCPFDTEESQFYRQLMDGGWKVIRSHISDGKDFYEYEPERWDIICSNPPFTNKKEIFERALSFDKPFALIMSNTWLNDSAPKRLFKDKDLQLLMFAERMSFKNNGVMLPTPTFSSSYFCYKLLPKQIIMESLNKNQCEGQLSLELLSE